MSTVIHSPLQLKSILRKIPSASLGFVPTMGALHEGHETLLKKSKSENSVTVLSIFINPTQFNNAKDLEKYPKTFEQDLQRAESLGVDFVFAPTYEDMYPDKFNYSVSEKNFSKELCGKDRPGHFEGVLTVVMKLLQLVQPTRAYFGEKDYQQLELIRGMAHAFFLDTEIVPVPTVREEDGLAMSSRNVRLSAEHRMLAAKIFSTLRQRHTTLEVQAELEKLGFDVDYVVDKSDRRFVAAKLGDVRLIDNVKI